MGGTADAAPFYSHKIILQEEKVVSLLFMKGTGEISLRECGQQAPAGFCLGVSM